MSLIGNTKPGQTVPVLSIRGPDEEIGVNAVGGGSGGGAAASSPVVQLRRLMVSPRIFDPVNEHVKTWFKHYDQVSKANGWTEDMQLAQLPVWVAGSAAKYIASQPDYKTFTEAKDALTGLFSTKGDDTDYEAMTSFKQTKGMGIRDYVVGKLEKIDHWKPTCDEADKVNFIRRGLRPVYRAQLHFLSYNNVDKLMRKLILLEEAEAIKGQHDESELMLSAEPINTTRPIDLKQSRQRTGECWGCGSLDHFQSNCPKRECYYCKKQGHIQATCWKRRQNYEQRPPVKANRDDERPVFQQRRVTFPKTTQQARR